MLANLSMTDPRCPRRMSGHGEGGGNVSGRDLALQGGNRPKQSGQLKGAIEGTFPPGTPIAKKRPRQKCRGPFGERRRIRSDHFRPPGGADQTEKSQPKQQTGSAGIRNRHRSVNAGHLVSSVVGDQDPFGQRIRTGGKNIG